MKIEITETNENQLLDRKDIRFKIMQTGATPSEKDVLKELAKTLKIDSTHIIIDAIYQKYSALECDGVAKIFKKAVREKAKEETPVAEEKKAETAEKPKAEEKKEKAPVAEEKKVETAEKPKAEEKKEKAPVAEEKKVETAEKPKAEEKKEKAPVAEEKKTETAEEPKKKDTAETKKE